MSKTSIQAIPSTTSTTSSAVVPATGVTVVNDEAGGENGPGAAMPTAFTPEQRIALVMACMPLVISLRKRISLYSTIWCIAGFVIALLAIPAAVSKHPYWAITALIYGGSLLFFAAIRILESRSLAALTDVGRSSIRRKVWMGFNCTILLVGLILFIVELFKPDAFPVWVAMPCTIFVMIVSASPIWEWFFVHRVIANSKGLVDDFCRSMCNVYQHPHEETTLPLLLESLNLLSKLQEKGALRMETFAAVRAELIGLGAAQFVAPGQGSATSSKPW